MSSLIRSRQVFASSAMMYSLDAAATRRHRVREWCRRSKLAGTRLRASAARAQRRAARRGEQLAEAKSGATARQRGFVQQGGAPDAAPRVTAKPLGRRQV